MTNPGSRRSNLRNLNNRSRLQIDRAGEKHRPFFFGGDHLQGRHRASQDGRIIADEWVAMLDLPQRGRLPREHRRGDR
jgi:hypothetical protein